MRILRSDHRPSFVWRTAVALLLPAALTVPADPAAAAEPVPTVAPAPPTVAPAPLVQGAAAGGAEAAPTPPPALRALAVAAQGAQEDLRTIVTKEVSVGRTESTLRLEFADGDILSAGIEEGVVAVDGREIGRVTADSELESAWRELLGRAVALENGPLARELVEWAPPADLSASALDAARELDRVLEERLRQTASSDAASDPAPSGERGARAVARLLARSDRLVELATILENVDLDDVRVHVDEDVEIDEGQEVDGSLLVVDGNVDVRGRVLGDVVVVGGTIRTHQGSRIGGDVRLSDGRLIDRGGDVEGRIVRGEDGRSSLEAEIRERVQQELEREVGRVRIQREAAPSQGFWDGVLRPFRWVLGGLADLVGNLLRMLLLAAIGMAVVAFGRENLEVVAETARRSPGRAAMVGVAGSFLILPVWVLGIVALAISIIGIPVLIAWLPLFPLAVALAMAFGYFAFAHNVGEWLAARRYHYLDWIRSSNAHTLVVGGILALMVPFLLSDLVQMFGPLLGFLQGILVALGIGLMVFATMVGFGAVLLTRAGRRPDHYGGGGDLFDDWDWRPSPRPSPGTGGAGRRSSTAGGPAGAGQGATGPSGPEASAGTGAPHGSRGSTGSPDSAGPGASGAPGGGPAGTGTSSPTPDLDQDGLEKEPEGGEESR